MKTVIHMAAECMLFEALRPDEFEAALAKFAELVRAEEREACAKVCDYAVGGLISAESSRDSFEVAVYLRDAIRARGQA